jgi:hypothetical protein
LLVSGLPFLSADQREGTPMIIDRHSDVRFFTRSFLLVLSCTLLSVYSDQAKADTIHHWRFENGGFLEDSVGDADLSNTTVTQIGLSQTDPVSSFPVPAGSAMNTSAAEFHDTGGLSGDIAPLVGSWTIEMLVRTVTLNGRWGQALFNNAVNRCNSSGNVGIQFRMDGVGGTSPGELAVFSGTTHAGQIWIPLGFVPETGKDYYLGFVHDDDANILTFYVQNLTEMGLLTSSTFEFEAYSFPEATGIEIGNISGGACGADSHAHDGLIDEVRISDVALPLPELYIADAIFKDGFESAF